MNVIGVKIHKQINTKPDLSLNLSLKHDIDDLVLISHDYKLYLLGTMPIFQVFVSVNYQLFHQYIT